MQRLGIGIAQDDSSEIEWNDWERMKFSYNIYLILIKNIKIKHITYNII